MTHADFHTVNALDYNKFAVIRFSDKYLVGVYPFAEMALKVAANIDKQLLRAFQRKARAQIKAGLLVA
jgi:hypothetical protein